MGKIFDALEKLEKGPRVSDHYDEPVLASEPKKQEVVSEPEKQKVVPVSEKQKVVSVPEKKQTNHKVSNFSKLLFSETGIDSNLVSLLRPGSLEAEQFNLLKTNIFFPSSGKRPRSIMVTSAVPGEGKSFVAANLAISIALNVDEYALLVDCDFRRPTVHKRFGFGQVKGLSEYLTNQADLSSVLYKTSVDKLNILPVGRIPHNPSELLSSNQMSNLIKELSKRYADRYIIIDSPPPQISAESNALARQVDGIILVIKSRSTPRKMVGELVATLEKKKILGVIVNWASMSASKYYSYGKYGRYYKE